MTATTAASNVENVVEIDDQQQTANDMEQCLDAISSAGDIYNQAAKLACKLYATTDADKRGALLASTDRVMFGTVSQVVMSHYELKTNPDSDVFKAMPEIARLSMANQIEKVDRSVIQDVARNLARHNVRMLDEQLGSYADAGPVYAGVPIGVDFGIEVGIKTGDGADTQRSGLVLGLRLDHLTGAKPSRELGIPKAKG
jgi:hypothetical protein